MEEIWLASIIFTGLVLTLVGVVLAAQRVLVPSEQVTIVVNGRKTLDVPVGKRLLRTLADRGIYLPAPCGGRGACGQCKVRILGEAQPLLPTEAAHIARAEATDGVRLACLLTVREALEIRVPEDALEVRRWSCTVESARSVTTYMKEVTLALPEGETIEFEAGEYVLLEAPPHRLSFADFDIDEHYRGEWERFRMFELRSEASETTSRAYSLANSPTENRIAMLVVRIATPPFDAPRRTPPGIVSSFIFGLKPGDGVTLSGPFGEFHAHDTDREMVFIAGGAGIAPMRSIIRDQLLRAGTTRKMTFWYGARNLREICYQEEFDRLARDHVNFSWNIVLSESGSGDNWTGLTGFVHTAVLDNYLENHTAPEDAEYYLCGPPLMSAATIQMLEDVGVERENISFDDFGA